MARWNSFEKGWIQAIERLHMPEGACIDVVNLVPNIMGALRVRGGTLAINDTPLGAAIHSLYALKTHTGATVRYQGAGTVLYRDFVALVTGLDDERYIEFASLRGFQEQRVYTFFANGEEELRYKDDGTTVTQWGLNPPTVAPGVSTNAPIVKVIEDFNGASIHTTYTATAAVLATETTNKLEGSQALKMTVVAEASGLAVRSMSAIDLTFVSAGVVSTDDDPIRLWVHVTLLANLDRLELALNYGSSPFLNGYYTVTIQTAQLNQSDYTWSEVVIPKIQFAAIGPTTPSWAAINGIRLGVMANVGGGVDVTFDEMILRGGVGIGRSTVPVKYRYKQIMTRKAIPTTLSIGQWTNAGGLFTDDTAAAQNDTTNDVQLSTLTNSDGHYLGADLPFAEAVYTISTAHSGGTPVYEYAYWNGGSWTVFTPDESPNFGATGITRLRFSFPTTNWRLLSPLNAVGPAYFVRVRATTAPTTTAALATRIRLYDSVVAARSNASPASLEATSANQSVTLTVINPTVVATPDYDPQITHVEIYRTVANATGENDAYLLENDVPAGVTTFTSVKPDTDLAEILELDNDRPLAFTTITDHQERIWGAVGNKLYPSKQFKPESFPATPIEVSTQGDPIQRIKQYDGVLYVWTNERIYQILGNDALSYIPRQLQCPTGLGAPRSIDRGERGIYFLGTDGNLWRLEGTSNAVNISHAHHYPLFHNSMVNDIAPLRQTEKSSCIGAWFNLRYYFFYPTGNETDPSTGFFIDEQTQTWWRDTRVLQSLFYDRSRDQLLGGDRQGTVHSLDVGSTGDNGVPVAWQLVTRDHDEQAPESDKEVVQLTIDGSTSGSDVVVEGLTDYGRASFALPVWNSAERDQSYLVGNTTPWKALGVRLTGSGSVYIARIITQAIIHPPTRRIARVLPNALGWPGEKRFEAIFLDRHLLAGALTIRLEADGEIVHTIQDIVTTRQYSDILPASFDAILFSWNIESTGTFRLYEHSHCAWLPLPPIIQSYRGVASDLGWPAQKLFPGFYLDAEVPLLTGTVTAEFWIDGALVHTVAVPDVHERVRTERLRLPETVAGKILELRIDCPHPFRLWPGTIVEWTPLGNREVQRHRLIEQDYGAMRHTPLLELLGGGAA